MNGFHLKKTPTYLVCPYRRQTLPTSSFFLYIGFKKTTTYEQAVEIIRNLLEECL
jgi:hypothetical protein